MPPDEFFEPEEPWWRDNFLYVPARNKRYPPLRGLCYRLLKEHGVGGVVYVQRVPIDDVT